MKKNIMIYLFLIAIIYVFVNAFINSKKEFKTAYNFIIDSIEVTPTKSLEFFKDTDRVRLWNYTISENENILIGDLLYKEEYSKYLYIYRKNKDGMYKEYLRVSPSGLFPYEWFCKK